MWIHRSSSLLAAASVCLGLTVGVVVGYERPEVDAGVALRLDTEGLVARSERIVEGRVRSRRTVERLDGSLDTEYRLDLARTFLGEPSTSTTVRIPGGVRADGSGLLIAGLPRLELGEEVLLFLGAEEAGRCLTVGLAQGRLTLLTDRHGVRRAVRSGGATALVGRAGSSGVRGGESRAYAELVAEIEAAVNARTAFPGGGDGR